MNQPCFNFWQALILMAYGVALGVATTWLWCPFCDKLKLWRRP